MDHRIFRKRVVMKKVPANPNASKKHKTPDAVRDDVERAVLDGRKIIFVDEVVFTRSTF